MFLVTDYLSVIGFDCFKIRKNKIRQRSSIVLDRDKGEQEKKNSKMQRVRSTEIYSNDVMIRKSEVPHSMKQSIGFCFG